MRVQNQKLTEQNSEQWKELAQLHAQVTSVSADLKASQEDLGQLRQSVSTYLGR